MPPQVTAGCGEGNVLFAQLVGREVSCGPWEARQVSAAPAASLYCRTTAAFHYAACVHWSMTTWPAACAIDCC